MPRVRTTVVTPIPPAAWNPLLNFGELQASLRVSKPVLRALLAEGMPYVRIGLGRKRCARRLRLESILGWLEARTAVSPRRRGRPHMAEGVWI